MSHQTLAEQCAATLAGIKTGNLFPVKAGSREEILSTLREWNRLLIPFGLRAIPLRCGEKGALVYLYRETALRHDLSHPHAQKILKSLGYRIEDRYPLLTQLAERMKETSAFPHEIGLFLGYPPEDVAGFLRNPNKGVKCIGVWKVYGDAARAQETFRKYRRCREYYSNQIRLGRPLQQLIVNTERNRQPAAHA